MLMEVRELKKVYQSGEVATAALDGVSLGIGKGEVVVALGPSGSGKTTLLNICGGLDSASSGQVFWGGEDITRYGQKELTAFRRNHVGFIFQGYNLLPGLTVLENVESGGRLSSDPIPARDILERVMLADKADKFPHQLSGGEQQRVSIARALAKNPKILFCDEPTGALDEKTGKAVLATLQKLNRELGTTLFIITHNPGIADMGHKVVRMNSGRVAELRTNDSVCEAHDIRWA